MTNCPNCGAPITGSVCEYCGTRHGLMLADRTFHIDLDSFPRSSPSEMLAGIKRHRSLLMQQCSPEELEQIRERNVREAVNAFAASAVETQRFADALREIP